MSDTRGPLPAPGSDENPIVIDPNTQGSSQIALDHDHVHDLEGRCVKRRAGARCTTPEEDGDPVDVEKATEKWLARFQKQVMPKMRASSIGMSVMNGWEAGEEIDPKAALEIGALILMEKPIIIIAGPDQAIPSVLEKIAAVVVRGELGEPGMGARIRDAIASIVGQPDQTPPADAGGTTA